MIEPYAGLEEIGLNRFTAAFANLSVNFQRLKILAQLGKLDGAEAKRCLREILDSAASMVLIIDEDELREADRRAMIEDELPEVTYSEVEEHSYEELEAGDDEDDDDFEWLWKDTPDSPFVDEAPDPDPEPNG